jgi:hypothetical protein
MIENDNSQVFEEGSYLDNYPLQERDDALLAELRGLQKTLNPTVLDKVIALAVQFFA